jgi:hypothetical protein
VSDNFLIVDAFQSGIDDQLVGVVVVGHSLMAMARFLLTGIVVYMTNRIGFALVPEANLLASSTSGFTIIVLGYESDHGVQNGFFCLENDEFFCLFCDGIFVFSH